MSESTEQPICEMTDWRGRPVVLLSQHWQHICTEHPDLFVALGGSNVVVSEMVHAIQNPVLMRQDERRPWVSHVFGRSRIGLYLRVIIWESESAAAIVRTAHLTKRLGRKGAQLWP